MLRRLIMLYSVNAYSQNAVCLSKSLHTTHFHLEKINTQEVANKCNKTNEPFLKYEKQQEEKILNVINNCNLDELICYEISKARASKLLGWRMRHGHVKNLNDILLIEGFGLKVAEKFFESVFVGPKPNALNLTKSNIRTAPFIAPPMEVEQRKSVKSSASIRIGMNSISWARLDIPAQDINAPCMLTHWQHHEISEKKLHINELIQRCLYVHHLIPTAECYLFENPQIVQASSNPGSVEQQNINIQKAQVTAIMGYALASRNAQFNVTEFDTSNNPKYFPTIFYVRRLLSARLFNNLVGTERVSSEETILNMMRTFYNTSEVHDSLTLQKEPAGWDNVQDLNGKLSSCVQFPTELRQMFANVPRSHREFLSQALLLNLTFVRLVLLQDSESIAAVSRANKSKTLNKP